MQEAQETAQAHSAETETLLKQARDDIVALRSQLRSAIQAKVTRAAKYILGIETT